jgi:GST-like protein
LAKVKRLVDEINQRPAVARVNKLKEKHAFKQEFDDEAKRHLFPHQTQRAG